MGSWIADESSGCCLDVYNVDFHFVFWMRSSQGGQIILQRRACLILRILSWISRMQRERRASKAYRVIQFLRSNAYFFIDSISSFSDAKKKKKKKKKKREKGKKKKKKKKKK